MRQNFIIKSLLPVFYILVLSVMGANAQVLQVESFESSLFPAPGWKNVAGMANALGTWRLQTQTLTNPSAMPPVGTKALIYNSATASVNDTVYLISKPFDFSACGNTNPFFSFKMYRDNGLPTNIDRIEVFINTSPTITGATPVNHQAGSNSIQRYYNSSPVAMANSWAQYTFMLNAANFNNGPNKTYIILRAIAGGGLNMYIDDFKVNTFPSPMNPGDVSMNIYTQNVSWVNAGMSTQWVIGVRCVVAPGSGCGNLALNTAVKIDSLLFSTAGTTSLQDIRNARVWYTGGSSFFSSDYHSPFPTVGYPTKNYGQLIQTPGQFLNFLNNTPFCFHLEYDTSYFWLTYDVSPGAVINNLLDAEFLHAKLSPSGLCPEPIGSASAIFAATQNHTLPGGLLINLSYCTPLNYIGTSRGNYTNNDFINHTEFLTALPPSFINTTVNSVSVQDPASGCYPNCPFTGHPSDYELWPNVSGSSVNLIQGGTYTFRAQCGTWYSNNYIQAWIDFNYDGDFYDANEKLAPTLTNLSALQWQNFSFTVPAASITGPTRLRIREATGISNMDPCATYNYGETEDYTITILPNCPTGNKLWLGYTDNWNDVSNWCGGLPGSQDDARIDKAMVPGINGRSYYPPVIGNNVKAYTKDLFISAADTLQIDAAIASDTSLSIRGNLINNGVFKVNSSYTASPVSGNSTITNQINTPFRGQLPDARTQMLFSATELSQWGFMAGDNITALKFDIYSKNSTSPYNNFTISYGIVPGSVDMLMNNIPLATPNMVFGPQSLITVVGMNFINLSSPIIWDGISSIVIQLCFDNTGVSGNDQIYVTQTTGRKTFCLLTSTSGISGCTLVPGSGVSDNFFASLGTQRPVIGFVLNRPYKKARVGIRGNWNNNGNFYAGNGLVIMDSSLIQNIQGIGNMEFHELEISKANSGIAQLQRNVIVNDTLNLKTGKLLLNKQSLTINNPAGTFVNTFGVLTSFSGPITRTAGFIISEDSLSRVILNTGGGTPFNGAFRVIPFASNSSAYIPFSMKQISGDPGMFTVATYATNSLNNPYPPTVFHVNDTGLIAVNNSAAAIDRYWITKKGAAAAVADVTFRWAATEKATVLPVFNALNNPPRAYPWRVSSNGVGTWLKTFSGPVNSAAQLMVASPFMQANNAGFDSVKISGFNWPQILPGNSPWITPAEPMSNPTTWIVAGSSGAGTLGNGTITLTLQLDSVKPNCNQSSNGGVFISVTSGLPPYQFLWSNGATTQDITGLTNGTYSVTVTDATGLTQSFTASVINASSPSTPVAISGPSGVCPGSTGIVYSIPVVAGITMYQWVLPSYMTPLTSLNQPVITVNIGNTLNSANIEVRQGNQCGWSSARTKIVSSGIPLSPGKLAGPLNGVCNSVQTYSITPVTQATTYLWVAPAGATIISGQGTTAVTISYPSGFNSDTIRLSAGNSCGFSPVRKIVVRGKPASPGVITGPSTACNGQSGVLYSIAPVYGAMVYTWAGPSGATITNGQGTVNATVKFGALNGSISVMAGNACGLSVVSSKSITINCREGDIAEKNIGVFPNPSLTEFSIHGIFQPVNAQVYDMTGKEIFNGLIGEKDKFGNAFVPGIYVVRFKESSKEHIIRIVKM